MAIGIWTVFRYFGHFYLHTFWSNKSESRLTTINYLWLGICGWIVDPNNYGFDFMGGIGDQDITDELVWVVWSQNIQQLGICGWPRGPSCCR